MGEKIFITDEKLIIEELKNIIKIKNKPQFLTFLNNDIFLGIFKSFAQCQPALSIISKACLPPGTCEEISFRCSSRILWLT